MKTKINWVILLLILFLAGSVQAQQVEEQKKEINRIKKSSLYLYAETTMSNQQEAQETAEELLQKEAQRWAQQKRQKKEIADNLVLTNIAQVSTRMELPRGNMYRCFVYVKKSDILVAQNAIVTELRTPSTEQDLVSTVESIREVPKTIERLLELKKSEDIIPCLKALQAEGKIQDYKPYAELAQPEDYVLIIHNRQGEVEAILSEGTNRINWRTHQADGVKNYRGRGAVGVKLK